MPIPKIAQPDFLPVDDNLRLRKFDNCFDFAFAWYQDEETVWLVDGNRIPYSPERLERMYRYLDAHGELYFIEVMEEGLWKPIGDVTFWQEDMPIVIGDSAYRGKGIGKKVIGALIGRGLALGYEKVRVEEIYHWNLASRKCFESMGFRESGKTETGSSFVLPLNGMQAAAAGAEDSAAAGKDKGEYTMQSVQDRFLRYVSFDTQSDETSETCPSTAKQKLLGAALVEEMKEMGICDAFMDENGYVYGTVPGDPEMPTIGLIAHMDTSPDASGADIRAKILEYNGGDVCLNEEKGIYLKPSDYPSLKNHIGKHLIVTDGTTLLGADDKAGIAEIMTAAQRLIARSGKHATLKIGFTPDEEIGRGADKFDIRGFGADFAYTADGGPVGEIEYENFNGAAARVLVHGRNIHPGAAKDKMVNSQLIAMEFASLLPEHQRPEHTEGYEGFFHLIGMKGEVEESELLYIIRDHDMAKFEEKKAVMAAAAAYINAKYGAGTLELTIRDSYFNMRKCIEPVMFVVDRAKEAMRKAGMHPVEVPIRGGTDGAKLSYEGLPCPNLCTGGENYHGRFEFIPVEDMEKCVQMLVALLTI
nr:peptidase T [Oscillospiraceae bacterium]